MNRQNQNQDFLVCVTPTRFWVCDRDLYASHNFTRTHKMAASLHQIARGGVVEEGENFFREVTDSKGEKAANAVDGMQR